MSWAGGHRRCRIGLIALVAAASGAIASSAAAQSVSPSPRPPVLDGEVSGSPAAGGRIEIKLDALLPGGWQGLHLLDVAIVAGEEELDRVTYDTENVRIVVGGRRMVVGTGDKAESPYLRVRAADVIVTTGGANLSLRVVAQVVHAIPEGARFVLSATGDRGEFASIRRGFAVPPDTGGLSWSTVATAVALALLAGAFGGNLFAAHRRPPARMSVYGTIQRRIASDRESTTRSP